MIKTIFSGNRRKHTPAFATVYGDGRGYDYKYDNYPTRLKRDEMDGARDSFAKLYRINVWPKRGTK